MYSFLLYGICVQAETELDILGLLSIHHPSDCEPAHDSHTMKLSVVHKACSYVYGIHTIEPDRYLYHIPGCCYIIGNGQMEVHYTDVGMFIETFMNVPMSLYIAVNRLGVLLHAASVCRDGQVTAFSGRKRAGKSTVLQTIIRDFGSAYSFYSDDTVRLLPGERCRCFPSLPILKAEAYNGLASVYRSSSGKNFYLIDQGRFNRSYHQPYELQNVYFLRDRSKRFGKTAIDDPSLIRMLICKNLSGYLIFPEELKRRCIGAVNELCLPAHCALLTFSDDKAKLHNDIEAIQIG